MGLHLAISKPILIALAISGFSAGCGRASRESTSGLSNVFGPDDREALTTDQYPWKALGYLSTGCTGTLVGPDLVVTAAHCVINEKTGEIKHQVSFMPNYRDGTSARNVAVTSSWLGTLDPFGVRAQDWAILRLAEAVGNDYGWLGAVSTDLTSFPDELTIAGYSEDFQGGNTAGVHHNCKLRGRWDGLIEHDCDTARGSSGGPVLRMDNEQLTIFGLHVAEVRDGGESSLHLETYQSAHRNIAIPSEHFMKVVVRLRAE